MPEEEPLPGHGPHRRGRGAALRCHGQRSAASQPLPGQRFRSEGEEGLPVCLDTHTIRSLVTLSCVCVCVRCLRVFRDVTVTGVTVIADKNVAITITIFISNKIIISVDNRARGVETVCLNPSQRFIRVS